MTIFGASRCLLFLCALYTSCWLFLIQAASPLVVSFVLIVQAITLLLYPVLGLLTDTYFDWYNFVSLSLVSLLVSSLLRLVVGLLTFILAKISLSLVDPTPWYLQVMLTLFVTGVILSLGMFQATAIHFGMDQMVAVSSDQISAFVHWSYRRMSFDIGTQTLVALGSFLLLLCLSAHAPKAYSSRFVCVCICMSVTHISRRSLKTKRWQMQYRHNVSISQT